MHMKDANPDHSKALARLVQRPAVPVLTPAARVVAANRKLIRKAMRLGYGLEVISQALNLPKRTLQRELNEAGLFFRKPRSKKGRAVAKNVAAIAKAKQAALANV